MIVRGVAAADLQPLLVVLAYCSFLLLAAAAAGLQVLSVVLWMTMMMTR
jgi:hypothetical protein